MISIIIPSLEGYDDLNKRCVRSFKSTAPSDAQIEFLVQSNNQSFAKNVNKGLELSRGHIVIICNNDVVALPGWYEHITKVIKKGNGIYTFSPRPDCGWMWAITRPVLDKIGILDEALVNSYEEYDYFIRAALEGYNRILAPKLYALHEGGHTLNKIWGDFAEARPERMQQCHENRDYMLNKWPGVDIDRVPEIYWAYHAVEIMNEWQKKLTKNNL